MDDLTRRAAAVLAEALADGYDLGEFLADAMCQVAADEGGIEEVVRNRPGSWEAGHIRNLMTGTVGDDGAGLAWYYSADPDKDTIGTDEEPAGTYRISRAAPPGTQAPNDSAPAD